MEDLQQIISLTKRQLYETYLATFLEDDDKADQIEDIDIGTKGEAIIANLDIMDIIEEDEGELPKDELAIHTDRKKGLITIYDQTFRLKDYRREKARRYAIMKRELLEFYSDTNLFSPNDLEEENSEGEE